MIITNKYAFFHMPKTGDMDSLKELGIKKYLVKPITLQKVKELFEPFSDYFA